MKKGKRKHFFDENYFERIDTEYKAYWLGFISADGCIVKTGKYNSYRLCINLGIIDEEHLLKFLNCVNAKDVHIQHFTNYKGFSNKNGTKTSRIVLNSFKLCKDLSKYYVNERKSYSIQFPNIDDNMIKHYLRGFIDGDGSYYCKFDSKNNRYRYSFEIVGSSLVFMKQVKKYLLSKGISLNIYFRKTNNSIRLMSGSKKEMLKIIDFLYSDAYIYLKRKYEKIVEIKNIAV